MATHFWLNAREARQVLEVSGFEGLGKYETIGTCADMSSVYFPEAAVVLQVHSVCSLTVEALRGPFTQKGFIPFFRAQPPAGAQRPPDPRGSRWPLGGYANPVAGQSVATALVAP